jgi:hypothetical protein
LRYWMFITRPEFWEQLKPPTDYWIYRRKYDYMNINDKAIIFVSRQTGFTGAVEITSGFRLRGRTTPFPYSTSVRHLVTLNKDKYVRVQEHLDKIDLFRGKSSKGWGATLQKSIIGLDRDDYNYIYNILEKAQR